MTSDTLDDLLRRRHFLRQQLADVGDLRPGYLFSRFRRCGKPNCHCARKDDPGHGPSWFLQRQVGEKMKQRSIPTRVLGETRQQIVECARLHELTRELIEVNEGICHRRLRADQRAPAPAAAKKGGSTPRSPRRAPPKPSG